MSVLMLKLYKWIKGYYIIKARGNIDRFIEVLSRNNIYIWNIEKIKPNESNVINACFCINRGNSNDLIRYAKKTQTQVEIIKERSLKEFIKKYKNKLIFLFGILFFVCGIYVVNLYIWDIEICGEYAYSKEEILKNIKSNYVKYGDLKSSLDCSLLEEKLRNDYEKIAWISCDIKGTKLTVNIKETLDSSIHDDSDIPCNIVASKDAVISEIITRSGSLVKTKGDEVKKGDILITGVVNISNEFDELIETKYIKATGDVYGITKYKYNDSFELRSYKKEYIKTKKKYSFRFMDNIFFNKEINENNVDVFTSEKKIRISKNIYLPISIYRNDYKYYRLNNKIYTKNEAINKAHLKLDKYLDELRKKGVEILENNVKIYIDNGKCISKGDIIVRELIGIPKNLEIIN